MLIIFSYGCGETVITYTVGREKSTVESNITAANNIYNMKLDSEFLFWQIYATNKNI